MTESGISLKSRPHSELNTWANTTALNLPAAFVEWAEMDPEGNLLSRFSNCDSFDWMNVGELPDGRKALYFHKEHQGNFDAACLLDSGEDPPVIFIWYDGQWVNSCSKFSNYIFTQIFDWQHKLLFDENDQVLDLNYRQILLNSAKAVEHLSIYEEMPSNSLAIDDTITIIRRFQSPDNARATVQYSSIPNDIHIGGAECIIEITASNDEKSFAFESELLDLLTDFVVAPVFHCPHHPKDMLRMLDYYISNNLRTQIKHLSDNPLSDEIVDLLVNLGRDFPFEDRVEAKIRDMGEPPREEWIGGSDWGIRMKIVRVKHGWIRVDKMEAQ